jgi:hypothetical protein
MKYAMVLLLTVLACREVNIGGEYAVGTVINLGDPAADGCGWVVVGKRKPFSLRIYLRDFRKIACVYSFGTG